MYFFSFFYNMQKYLESAAIYTYFFPIYGRKGEKEIDAEFNNQRKGIVCKGLNIFLI